MHDLDRALQEFEQGFEVRGQGEGEYEGVYEAEREAEYQGESPYAGEAEYQGEDEYQGEGEYQAEGGYQAEEESSEGVFDELQEMEQAAALLEVQDEGELEQFLGGLIDAVKSGIKAFVPPDVQRALTGALKNVARVALPKVGAVLGNMIVPGAGGVLGAAAASNAGKMFGLELEGMSHEDQEFEIARRLINLGAEATRAVAEQGALDGSATDAAHAALIQAAQMHAPGLAAAINATAARAAEPPPESGGRRYPRGSRPRSGRWIRHGHRIVLVGV